MAVMLAKTYAAFKAAGVPEDQAREASEEIAGLNTRLTRIEVMLAALLAIGIAILVRLFTI